MTSWHHDMTTCTELRSTVPRPGPTSSCRFCPESEYLTPGIDISDQIFSVYPNIFLLQSKRREPEHVAAVREEETIERGEILCHKLPPHAGPSLHFLRRVQDRTLLCAASTHLLSNTAHTKHALLWSSLCFLLLTNVLLTKIQ